MQDELRLNLQISFPRSWSDTNQHPHRKIFPAVNTRFYREGPSKEKSLPPVYPRAVSILKEHLAAILRGISSAPRVVEESKAFRTVQVCPAAMHHAGLIAPKHELMYCVAWRHKLPSPTQYKTVACALQQAALPVGGRMPTYIKKLQPPGSQPIESAFGLASDFDGDALST